MLSKDKSKENCHQFTFANRPYTLVSGAQVSAACFLLNLPPQTGLFYRFPSWLVFRKDAFFCTLFVFAFIWVIYALPVRFEFLNPLDDALSDFESTDIVFSKLRKETAADTGIVLVNIGRLNREGIAAQLTRINADSPLVVAIDAFFYEPKDPAGDSALAAAFAATKNLVLVSKLENPDQETGAFGHLRTSQTRFSANSKTGFANLISEGDDRFRTSREFSAREIAGGKAELAFPVAIAQQVNPAAVQRLLSRNTSPELINFRGNADKFYALDVADIFDPNLKVSFRNKIVLMGYMGSDFGTASWEDKFYTPLNEKYAGKTYPDMFGVVVHANILSMVLEGNYINQLPRSLSSLLAVVICYLNLVFFFYVHERRQEWYDVITKSVQLAESIFLLFLALVIFQHWHFKTELTLAIVALLLSGDLLEVFVGGVQNVYTRIKNSYVDLRKKP